MTEPAAPVEPAAPETPDQAAPGFGALLRAERERQGLGEDDMVARLRLHPRQVRAIESEDLAALPGAAYVRGFVRSYARNLGLAPEPLLDDLSRKLGVAPPSVDALADDSPRSPVRAAAREQNSRRVVLLGGLASLLLLGLLGWWANRPAAPPAAPVVEPAAVTAPVAPAASEPAAAPEPAAALPPAPLLKLAASGKSWVRVEAAGGEVLFEQLLDKGSEETVEGIPPLTVVVGDASQVKLELRGEPVDLARFTQKNVARLRLE